MNENRSRSYFFKELVDSIDVYERFLNIEKLLREQTPLEDKEPHGEADQELIFIRKSLRRQKLILQNLQKKILDDSKTVKN